MKKPLVPLIALFGVPLLFGCGRNVEYKPDVEIAKIRAEEGLDSPRLEPTDEGFAISAPSDPKAAYRILKIKMRANGNFEVLSRRDGPSGTSFSRREIDCGEYTFRYLGEGDTRADAESDSPNLGNMSALTGASASSDVADAACRKGAK